MSITRAEFDTAPDALLEATHAAAATLERDRGNAYTARELLVMSGYTISPPRLDELEHALKEHPALRWKAFGFEGTVYFIWHGFPETGAPPVIHIAPDNRL